MGSHSVTCHPTQVNTPRINPSQTGWYLIYLPWRDGRLSWPRWQVTYQDGLVYSPYARCNASVLQRLQRVQNCAVRYILNAPPRSPSLPLLHKLHWLPIESRICYKLCSLMYRVIHNTAPSYLSELCMYPVVTLVSDQPLGETTWSLEHIDT